MLTIIFRLKLCSRRTKTNDSTKQCVRRRHQQINQEFAEITGVYSIITQFPIHIIVISATVNLLLLRECTEGLFGSIMFKIAPSLPMPNFQILGRFSVGTFFAQLRFFANPFGNERSKQDGRRKSNRTGCLVSGVRNGKGSCLFPHF